MCPEPARRLPPGLPIQVGPLRAAGSVNFTRGCKIGLSPRPRPPRPRPDPPWQRAWSLGRYLASPRHFSFFKAFCRPAPKTQLSFTLYPLCKLHGMTDHCFRLSVFALSALISRSSQALGGMKSLIPILQSHNSVGDRPITYKEYEVHYPHFTVIRQRRVLAYRLAYHLQRRGQWRVTLKSSRVPSAAPVYLLSIRNNSNKKKSGAIYNSGIRTSEWV